MQSGLRWSGLVSRLHSPAAARLTCSRLSPLCCAGTLASVSCFASVYGQWPAAMHLVCAPPTLGLATLRVALARRGLPVRPQGAPSVRAGGRGPDSCRRCAPTLPNTRSNTLLMWWVKWWVNLETEAINQNGLAVKNC